MRSSRVGPLLLGLGVVVGVAAGVGLLLGFEPAKLPQALLNIAAYKLTFLASAGLIAAGALLLRYGRREPDGQAAVENRAGKSQALGEGRPGDAVTTDGRRPDPVRARESRVDH